MSVFAPAVLAASLMWWPFGDKDKDKQEVPREETIESLEQRPVDVPPAPTVSDAEARARARENYRLYLEMGEGDPARAAEALRRLADLELEAAESQALDSGADTLQAGVYAEAVSLYQRMLTQYPDYARNDLVYYQLARAQESGGDPAAALQSLNKLVEGYPESPLMAEVQFRRGEILFSGQNWTGAEAAYQAVLDLPGETDFDENALYKEGWSRFRQGEYASALDAFMAVLDGRLTGVDAKDVDDWIAKAPRAQAELIEDTLRVSSLSFSYLDGQNTIHEVLAQHGNPSYGHVLYQSLAALYLNQERYTDASTVLAAFVEAEPTHPRAPYLQMAAIQALSDGGFPEEVMPAREQFVERFGLDQPYWETQAPEDHPEVVAYLRDSVWMLSQQAHADLQQLPKTATPEQRAAQAALAIGWYQRYLQYFPDDERAPESQFLLAELLHDTGDDVAAVDAYEKVAYDKENPRSAEAGYASLIAYQAHLAKLSDPAEIDAWTRRGLEARLRFASTFPQHPNAVLAQVDAAEGYYKLGEGEAAIAAANGVIAAPAATQEEKRLAWQVIGNTHFDDQQWAEAEAAFTQMRDIDAQTGKTDPALTERLAASIYSQGQAARESGDAVAAAGHFQRVAGVAPNSSIRVTADYDAAMAMYDAKQPDAAIPLLLKFRQEHPDSDLNSQVTASLALAYVDAGNESAAATEFERIAGNEAAPPAERQEALLRSAELYRKLGVRSSEARVLEAFVDRYPDQFSDALESEQRLFELATEAGDSAAQQRWANRLIAFDAQAGAQRNDRSRYLAAKASMVVAEPVRQAYEAVKLDIPLDRNLKAKRARLEEALAAYERASKYGVAEVLTEATFRTAELYSGMAKALMESERPKGLDELAREEYDLLVEEQAFPFEEKSIAIHEANTRRAAEGLYDDWVRRSYAELARLSPGRYGKTEMGVDHVDRIR